MSAQGPGPASWRNFYGRRHGKTLRPVQRRLIDELLPRLAIPGVAPPGDPAARPIEPAALFGPGVPLWLEIGFGGGEHLAGLAAQHPDAGLIGCEPFVNGVAMLLTRLEVGDIGNVRLHAGDARDLIDLLPAASLARVYLLYPDPWPKQRHHRRRFLAPDTLAALARVMAPGAELRLATDIPAYVAHVLAAVAKAGGFRVMQAGAGDWSRSWPGWEATRYEIKALRAGRRPQYLRLVRDAGVPAIAVDRPVAIP